jgi:hypothetical protein
MNFISILTTTPSFVFRAIADDPSFIDSIAYSTLKFKISTCKSLPSGEKVFTPLS